MKMRLLYIVLFALVVSGLWATHNRAGEIIYKRIPPLTENVNGVPVPVYNYSITVIAYTDHGPSIADRCADTVYFGDGQRGIAYRVNGGFGLNCECSGTVQCGDLIINNGSYKVKRNIYTITHRYPGAGTYTIQMFDPNRNQGVHNIPNSDQQPFYLESYLMISNFSGANSSPVFNCEPIYRACLGKCFYHNPCAFDSDGDSLSYIITTSRGYGGSTVPGYSFPETGGGYYGIDAVSGVLTWCTPQVKAEYNIAFIVQEWRKNSSGTPVMIGYVLRDMQVVVEACPNNDPPLAVAPPDTCVEAGTVISKIIKVSDPNSGQVVTVSGFGGAFATNVPPIASLNPNAGSASGYTTAFTWATQCGHIRQQPYQSVIVAVDNWAVPLAYYADYNIKVVPPTIKNVSATPQGSNMKITWALSTCSASTNNPLVAYKIYRRDSCVNLVSNPCQTGIAPTSGFNLIGQTNTTTSQFIDDNGGQGLIVGKSYSYLVLAAFKDGTETYASVQVCAKLIRNIPVITKVDILTTSVSNGSVAVAWVRPLTDAANLDTNVFKGPYTYNVKYRLSSGGSYSVAATFTSDVFLALPLTFTHNNLNTQDMRPEYQIEFIAGTVNIGSSPLATSVYLKSTPSDRQVQLKWSSATPWDNYLYKIWRKNPGSSVFVLLDSTKQTQYLDKKNLANRNTYCYKITSYGEYSEPAIPRPLINNSEESCALTVDNVAPCSPSISIQADCPMGVVAVSWNDITQEACGDDVISYALYFKQTVNDDYTLVYQGPRKTYSPDDPSLVYGCYAIEAIDSTLNRSQKSADFCIENCPVFELPNIVTDNGDGVNDFYKAVKVRQIKEIDLKIFDRWGNLVYTTNDPYFQWNTISSVSGLKVSEGTFFYLCDVFEPRLKGIVKRSIKGYLEVVR
ncbi:MAG TPA: gliding motility-associated C-terminal domain-containing protein [Bacteroidia bacterium]|nr:gliding motility-associated C-terminal domain-containing protein [Bacteroidia bacterium]